MLRKPKKHFKNQKKKTVATLHLQGKWGQSKKLTHELIVKMIKGRCLFTAHYVRAGQALHTQKQKNINAKD